MPENMEDEDRPGPPLVLVDGRGRALNDTPLAHMITVAAAKLFAKEQPVISRAMPELKTHPRAFGRGFTAGVCGMLSGLADAGVDIRALLKNMGLFP